MDHQKTYDKQLALCGEIDAVIHLSSLAQTSISNEQLFMRHLAQLFHRIDIMEALKDEVMLCVLKTTEAAARQAGVSESG